MKTVCLIPLIVFLMINQASADSDSQTEKEKIALCQSCHNSSFNHHPNLEGQNEKFIIKALNNFRSEFWPSPTMSPIAANLSDQDIKGLATYFSRK